MDYSSLVIAAGIVLYAIYEYRRREGKHRLEMEFLRRNTEPPPEGEEFVPRWRIATLILTALIAVAAAGIIIYRGITTPHYGKPLIVIGGIFFVLSAPLFYMIVRDIKMPRGRLRRGQ